MAKAPGTLAEVASLPVDALLFGTTAVCLARALVDVCTQHLTPSTTRNVKCTTQSKAPDERSLGGGVRGGGMTP